MEDDTQHAEIYFYTGFCFSNCVFWIQYESKVKDNIFVYLEIKFKDIL